MKTLEEFRLVKEFLSSQGIQPTVAMVALDGDAWADMVILAEAWKSETEQPAEEEDPLAAELRTKMNEEQARLEEELLLFHSSGYLPRRDT